MTVAVASWWLLGMCSAAVAITSTPACRLSEYSCGNGHCVPLNRYCDNMDDCGDSSDEPRYCTPCNRTYYGDVGRTYSLELHRPKEDRLPFICYLTFKAGGAAFGDIVQLTFDTFTIGRFVSFTRDGCPDGSLQIAEGERPQVGGSWCGSSWGPAMYYSETDTLIIALRLFRLSKDQNGYNFDFRVEYKVLRQNDAIVRYGGQLPTTELGTTNATGNAVVVTYPKAAQTAVASVPNPFFTLLAPPAANTSAAVPIATTAADAQAAAAEFAANKYYLGDLISGTYCSRIFSDCDKRRCRLQSPNFPGVYPRNLTCYYAVRQHEIPLGKHAMITVRQPKGQLVAIRSQSALYGNQQQQHQGRDLKVWKECDDVQDYVTVYDGYTTRDPVILKFCGGGEAVPEAVSSGHELLVEFTTSPYGTFLHPQPIQALHGFQLEVEVKFVDLQSPTYVKTKRTCEFWLRGTNRGILESPQHSLSPNTTCLYHLQGIDTSVSPTPGPFRSMPPRYPPEGFSTSTQYWRRAGLPYPSPRYRVWFSLLKFHVKSAIDSHLIEEETCASHLNIWDGMMKVPSHCSDLYCDKEKSSGGGKGSGSGRGNSLGGSGGKGSGGGNSTLLARFCKDRVPRSCDHSLLQNGTRHPRPCALRESFLSSGDSLTLELRLTESTALRPVTFRALYEFVDLYQDGEPYGSGPCSRRFISRSQEVNQVTSTKFHAPRDIFLYGRGGNTNLSCVYRFEAQKGERVKLTLTRLVTGGRLCKSREDLDQGRLQCYGNTSAAVRLYELPWHGEAATLPRDCLCSNETDVIPFTFISTAHLVELHFDVFWMNATDDFSTMFFEGTWEFIRKPVCSKTMRVSGASGEIKFRAPSRTPDEVNCENHPWLITPSHSKFLYVKSSGHILKPITLFAVYNNTLVTIKPFDMKKRCYTKNRIAIYTGRSERILICPYKARSVQYPNVEVFSVGWAASPRTMDQSLGTPVMDRLGDDPPKSIVVEFLGREIGSYSISFLELARRKPFMLPQPNHITGEQIEQFCMHRCPELDACINSSLWCDGIDHCPSGYDEALTHCSFILQLPVTYLISGVTGILVLIGVCCAVAFRLCRRRRRSILQTRLKSLSSDTAIIDEKEVIC